MDDGALIVQYKQTENAEIIGVLFKRYTHLVYGVCMKYLKDEDDSKDAVMQIFEKLLRDLKKHEVQNFKGWLHTVAKNYCLMQLRKKNPETHFFCDSFNCAIASSIKVNRSSNCCSSSRCTKF